MYQIIRLKGIFFIKIGGTWAMTKLGQESVKEARLYTCSNIKVSKKAKYNKNIYLKVKSFEGLVVTWIV